MKKILSYLRELYQFYKWKTDDKLFMLTKLDKFYHLDEQAVYDGNAVGGTPRIESLPFHIFLPYDAEVGKEYFIVCDHYSRFLCTKAAKISFYKADYINDKRRLGKKNWILNRDEKTKLVNFLKNEIPGFTSGLSLFNSLIEQYNLDQNPHWCNNPEFEIPEDLPMPNYMQLPEKI